MSLPSFFFLRIRVPFLVKWYVLKKHLSSRNHCFFSFYKIISKKRMIWEINECGGMVDAPDLGSGLHLRVWVQVPPFIQQKRISLVGYIAQLVEQRTSNSQVGGSSPSVSIFIMRWNPRKTLEDRFLSEKSFSLWKSLSSQETGIFSSERKRPGNWTILVPDPWINREFVSSGERKRIPFFLIWKCYWKRQPKKVKVLYLFKKKEWPEPVGVQTLIGNESSTFPVKGERVFSRANKYCEGKGWKMFSKCETMKNWKSPCQGFEFCEIRSSFCIMSRRVMPTPQEWNPIGERRELVYPRNLVS